MKEMNGDLLLPWYKLCKEEFLINNGFIIDIWDVYILVIIIQEIVVLFKIYYKINMLKFQMIGNMNL